MLMNGKEVNHLIVHGEQFDKSNCGKKVKVVRDISVSQNNVSMNGNYIYYNHGGALIISAGTLGYVIGLTYGQCYYIFDATIDNSAGVWVPKDSVEILENGGVNSTPILLFKYCMEVMPSC